MSHSPAHPASCVLRVAPQGGQYQVLLSCTAWRQALPVPLQGELLADWSAAGLPPLCAARLLQVVRSGRAATWPIELPGAQPEAPLRGYLLSVSPMAPEDGAPGQACIVTLTPNHVAWPELNLRNNAHANGLTVGLTLDATLRLHTLEPAWTLLTGHPTETSLGQTLLNFLHPQAHERLRQNLDQPVAPWLDVEAPRLRLPLQHRNGNLVWVEVDFDALPPPADDSPAVDWQAQLEDVSDNVRTWHLDRVREQALDQSNCGVVITDATLTHQPIVYVNQRFTEITGYTLHEVLGRPCNFLQNSDTQQADIGPLREAIRQGDRASALLRNYRKSGEMFWNQLHVAPIFDEPSGILTHHFGILTDVTETRHLLAQVSRQAEQLHALHHDNPNGLIAFNDEDVVQLDNRAFVGLTGLHATGLNREAFYAALQSMGAPGQAPLAQALARGEALQWQLRKPRERVLEIRGSQPNTAGAPGLLVFRDVSADVQLYRLQKQFLATAAHEMRAPMGSIRGFSELLLTRQFPAEVQRDLLERIHRQSGRLSDLLNDLLNLARIEAQAPGSLKLEAVELQPLLHEVVRNFERPGVDSRLALRPGTVPAWVQGQRAKLEQVLINIVSNALKYSSARGLPVELDLRSGSDPQHWQVLVRDQGVGMSPQTLERLFTKFFRVDPHGDIEGTGLGLCIAKELTERMGGTIGVESQLGQGSVFTLNLLKSDPATSELAGARAPAVGGPQPHCR